jgi:hypothetical protein
MIVPATMAVACGRRIDRRSEGWDAAPVAETVIEHASYVGSGFEATLFSHLTRFQA